MDMWDEKKFFEDYAKEADKVQPSSEFVEKMVLMIKEEKKSKVTSFRNIIIGVPVVVAACLVLVFGIGSIGKNDLQNEESVGQQAQNGESISFGELAAGKNQDDYQFESFDYDDKKDALTILQQMLEDNDCILNADNVELGQDERIELLDNIQHATLVENTDEQKVITSYKVSGSVEIVLDVLENGYFSIKIGEEEPVYYHIDKENS